jgi:hypothetical protein
VQAVASALLLCLVLLATHANSQQTTCDAASRQAVFAAVAATDAGCTEPACTQTWSRVCCDKCHAAIDAQAPVIQDWVAACEDGSTDESIKVNDHMMQPLRLHSSSPLHHLGHLCTAVSCCPVLPHSPFPCLGCNASGLHTHTHRPGCQQTPASCPCTAPCLAAPLSIALA